ncbi:MAG: hypothetical protein RLZZ165_2170, partial [Bacteroidota bacterium]
EILKYLEKSGVKVMNSYEAYANSRDKLMMNLTLRRSGIRVPDTLVIADRSKPGCVDSFFEKHRRVVLKPRSNHGGKGILRFSDPADFWDYTEMVEGFFDNHYLEAFVDFGEMDYRVEVVNDTVAGGYRRLKTHPFKTNIGSGGQMVAELPGRDVLDLGHRAARAVKIDCTAVDIVRCRQSGELYVLEVNPIMGVFLETALRSGSRFPAQENVHELFQTDDLKMDLLMQMIGGLNLHT